MLQATIPSPPEHLIKVQTPLAEQIHNTRREEKKKVEKEMAWKWVIEVWAYVT
jgi:hypothetical protein